MTMTNPTIEAQLPSDEEMELFARYTAGSMNDQELDEFDDKMAQDDEFFGRMAPMLMLWKVPPASVATIRDEALPEARTAADPSITPIADRLVARDRLRRFRLHLVAALASAASILGVIAVRLLSAPVLPQVTTVFAAGPSIAPLGGVTAISTAAPRLTPPGVTQPITDIVDPTVIADAADSVVAKGSLATARTADAHVEADVEFKSNVDVATQWAQPEGERGLFGSAAHAVGEKLSEAWNKVRHAVGTHKPTGAPPPL
jgi:hypothetical protein